MVRTSYLFPALLILFAACFCTASWAVAPDLTKVVDGRKLLSDEELDTVTAGGVNVDFDLSAGAGGPNAITSAQGAIRTTRSPVLRIEVDPSAPEAARSKLLGVSTAELVFGFGKADAEGSDNVQCTAAPTVVADVTYLSLVKTMSLLSATCSCATFALGNFSQLTSGSIGQ